MKWFNNMKIGAKMLSGFILVALIAGSIGLIGVVNLEKVHELGNKMYEKMTVPLGQLVIMTESYQRMRGNVRDIILSSTAAEYEDFENRIKLRNEEFDKNLELFSQTLLTERGKVLVKNLRESKDKCDSASQKVISLAKAGNDQEAIKFLRTDVEVAIREIEKITNEIRDIKINTAISDYEINAKTTDSSKSLMIILLIAGMLIAIVLGLFISSSISSPVNRMVKVAGRIAEGDLDVEVHITSKDEVGVLGEAFKTMLNNLKGTAASIDSLSKGDLSVNISIRSEKDLLSKNLKIMAENLRKLASEAKSLTEAAIKGKLNARGNEELFNGGYKEIISGVNKTLDTLVGHIDAMPAPVMIIDKDFSILYMNKTGADILGTTQQQLIGAKCYDHFKTSDCKTAKCACAVAMQQGTKASSETDAHPRGMNLDISYSALPLKDENQNIIGAMELVTDQTAIKNAARVAKKQADYQDKEVSKLLANINNLAQGKLQCDAFIEPADDDTRNIKEIFTKIYSSYEDSINTISSYIKEISRVLTEMAEGNLNLGITGDYRGDFVEIKNSLNLIIDSLNSVMLDINSAAEQVATGAKQVSDSSMALSQGATEQASSIEQLTASIEEISSQTKQNAQNANQANELAENAKSNAVQGNAQMKEMLKAMEEINESSANISKIIKVIDEIAFQTNILALNAAVEAARAGQHGKGFAVVAEEVRNLAARSANAAKETTDMIEGSIKKVEGGTKIANETAAALNKIVDGVAKAAVLVGDIAIASNEQASGIAQINQGVMQVSQVTQTNSATSQESAAASEELSSQAELLRESVNKFKLKKVNHTYSKIEEFNPEVLKMIEEMSEKKKIKSSSASKPKISLSDRDFGKY